MESKRLICKSGHGDEVVTEVELNGVLKSETLTPKLAARAARVAFGHRNGVTVTSNDGHGYRLYAESARKIDLDDYQEAGMDAAYESNRKYDGMNTGHIPVGTRVRFVDGDTGRVIQGNAERSLVAYSPDRLAGVTEAREWFDNSALRLAISAQAMAEAIYIEAHGDVDDKRFRATKTGEIRDWLDNGDPDGMTQAQLVEEWLDYVAAEDVRTAQE